MTLPERRVVEWIDSSVQNGQVDRFDFPKPCVIRTTGFVVREDDVHILLARDSMGDGEYRGLVAIPTVALIRNIATTDPSVEP